MCRESMMIRLSSLPTGRTAPGPISHDESMQVDAVMVRLQGHLPGDRVIDARGPDLHLFVAMVSAWVTNGKLRMLAHGSKDRSAAVRTLRASRYSA